MKRFSFYILMQAGLALCILLMLLSGCVDKELNNPFDPNNGAQVIPAPTFSLASGTYDVEKVTAISCTMQGVTIRYTTDGSEPTSNSAIYIAPLSILENSTIKAKAYKDGWNPSETSTSDYQLQVMSPTINILEDVNSEQAIVSLSCATSGATVFYTLDNSEPTEFSEQYDTPLIVALGTTIKAKAYKVNWSPSTIVSELCVLTVANPIIKPAGGVYTVSQFVTISCATSGSIVRYTTNGSDPTENSSIYNSPLDIDGFTTLKAKAYKSVWKPSAIVSETYNFNIATPLIEPAGGIYTTAQTITISCATLGAAVRYTIDGSDPTESAKLYTDPFNISQSANIKARAYKVGWNPSSISQADYIIAPYGYWSQKANYPGIGCSNTVSFSINDFGYIVTGEYPTSQYTNELWEYNASTNAWTQKATMGGPDRCAGAGFSINNQGYYCCGWSYSYNNTCWKYDQLSNSWSQIANFPGPGRTNPIGFSIGNLGYIGAGQINHNGLGENDFWEYNPQYDAWTQRADIGGPARLAAVGFSMNGKGYVGTGQSANSEGHNGQLLNDFWEYNPTSYSWIQKASFGGSPRACSKGLSINGIGYIGTGGENLNDFWAYYPNENTWFQVLSLTGPGRHIAAAFSVNNKGYFGIGRGSSGENLSDFYEYTP